ncbi:DUF4351 domain-containing protein, partial [Microcystis sp. M095S1]|uniref:DUF4351 domain-containing protein n=1 Tax=Microcystis sp. M095S1 TaxID=2771136 RepID=UPI00258D66B0
AERIYVYNYRIFDKYRRRVASFIVLGDENTNWRPSEFGYEIFGCQVTTSVEKQVRQLSVEQLEDLGEALLDFENEADLLHWLSQNHD